MGAQTSDLVGRSQEIDRLTGVLTGDLHALVVEGDAGVGKTALLDDLRRRARAEGWSVARYQCVVAEQDFPYSTLDQILRPLAEYSQTVNNHARHLTTITRDFTKWS